MNLTGKELTKDRQKKKPLQGSKKLKRAKITTKRKENENKRGGTHI